MCTCCGHVRLYNGKGEDRRDGTESGGQDCRDGADSQECLDGTVRIVVTVQTVEVRIVTVQTVEVRIVVTVQTVRIVVTVQSGLS